MDEKQFQGPVFPRRAFVAAGISAILAAGVVAVGLPGLATKPKTQVFQFSRGTNFVQGHEEALRGFLAPALQDDRIAVVILGHTGSQGDADANQDLSDQRADVAREMALRLGIPAAQIHATGLGGSAPLAKGDDETDRAHQARLARVDVTLQVRR